MPAKIKVTREEIVDAALALVQKGSATALSARSVASEIGCSTQPIFSNFPNMDGLRTAVIDRAWELYTARIASDMAAGRFPPYKASGMSYIAFAVEEPQLFKLLFMRDRIADGDADSEAEQSDVIEALLQSAGLSITQARRFHREMWIFVHGLAVMIATRFKAYDEDAVSEMLSDVYRGLLKRFKEDGADCDD